MVTTVPPVVGVDLEQYQFSLITRFSNVHICDQVQRLAEDGSMKVSASQSFHQGKGVETQWDSKAAACKHESMYMAREMCTGRLFSSDCDFSVEMKTCWVYLLVTL